MHCIRFRESDGVPPHSRKTEGLIQTDESSPGGDITIISARKIKGGKGSGKAIVSSSPISFLGGIDATDGTILDPECDSRGANISGRVFCFPFGKGSTVGSYAMYQLRLGGRAPSAIINESAEPIVATGAIMAGIPMVDGVDVSLLRSGDDVTVDADEGYVELPRLEEKHVVTNIVRSKGRILLLRRSDKVGSYKGQWAGVSGFIEPHERADEAARRELSEEISVADPRFVVKADPMRFRDKDTVWCVHPFLVEVRDSAVRLDWEHQSYEWVSLEEVTKYRTVPGLHQVIRRLLEKQQGRRGHADMV